MKSILSIVVAILALTVNGLVAVCEDTFPTPPDTETSSTRPLSAQESVERMQMPDGFRMSVFASEPDVCQPISMTTDTRGRLWVAENYTYSERPVVFHEQLRDRILIFEDTDNDGTFDKRTVFWDGAHQLMSLEVGSGGVWALCLPELVFIADKDGDDVPDAEPQVHLDGFAEKQGSHTVANGLRWGPDGWLYGRQGIIAKSLVGKPGSVESDRTDVNVGIWRYHPTRHEFENVAYGTTNPWGMDWDEHGEMFFINTVIGHLWHVIPGAHYRRMSGGDLNPRIYDVIEQHADHVHWATGEVWTDVRKGVTDATLEAGGGHAHTGLNIYQGGQWPDEWSGKLLTVNYHGKRLNVERLERQGTGFVGKREPDAFMSDDPWFRGLDIIPAPDGSVYLSDWSDTGECHDNDGVHRSSGRIYKITYGDSQLSGYGDLNSRTSVKLAKLQLSDNVWLARTSQRVLVNRQASGVDVGDAMAALNQIAEQESNTVYRLRALWTLHSLGLDDVSYLKHLLADPNEHLRAWAIRLLEDQSRANNGHRVAFEEFAANDLAILAKTESSGLVRLTLASLLQKLPLDRRWSIASALLSHAEDADDHNQPLVLWCGILALAEADGNRFAELIAEAKIPQIQRYGARRLTEDLDTAPQELGGLVSIVAKENANECVNAMLDGITDSLAGRRRAPKPDGWDAAAAMMSTGANEGTLDRLRDLSALFGDGRALDSLRAAAIDPNNTLVRRSGALRTLVESRAPDLQATCEQLLDVSGLSVIAAGGLALSDDPAIADRLISMWSKLDGQDRNPMMAVLISRPTWVGKVLDAVADGTIEPQRLGAYQVRQIRAYGDAELLSRLETVLGKSATSNHASKPELIERWKKQLDPSTLAQADKRNGRAVFQTSCAICHQLNGEGKQIGPDLTGAARDNLSYLLENILTPSAVLADEYRQLTVLLDDGRVLVGIKKPSANGTLKLQTTTELVTLSLDEIEEQTESRLSMMPEGLLESLDALKVRDLFGYLMSKETPQ